MREEIVKLLEHAHTLMYANLEENLKLADEWGDSQMNKEQYKKALELYKRVLEKDPHNKEALDGKKHAEIMLEPLYPLQRMAMPPPLSTEGFLKRATNKSEDQFPLLEKNPWERKRGYLQRMKEEMNYTSERVGELFKKFDSECERLLKEAKEYANIHSKEDTWKIFSDKIMKDAHTTKIPYTNAFKYKEKLAKILAINDGKINEK